MFNVSRPAPSLVVVLVSALCFASAAQAAGPSTRTAKFHTIDTEISLSSGGANTDQACVIASTTKERVATSTQVSAVKKAAGAASFSFLYTDGPDKGWGYQTTNNVSPTCAALSSFQDTKGTRTSYLWLGESNTVGESHSVSTDWSIHYVLPPVNTRAPAIALVKAAGWPVMSSAQGIWSGTDSPAKSFDYQWQTCSLNLSECVDIAGASGSAAAGKPGPSLRVRAEDMGRRVRVKVTAHNGSSSATAYSAASAEALSMTKPLLITAPHYSGSAKVGAVINTLGAEWRFAGTTAITYKWQTLNADGSWKTVGSAASYTIPSSAKNKSLRVVTTASNIAGSASVTSVTVKVIS